MADLPDIKRVGCCTLCDEAVMEIKQLYRLNSGHPYAGMPRVVGGPLADARRVTFLLADGSVMVLTFGTCERCGPDALKKKELLGEIFAKCVRSQAYEVEHHDAITLRASKPAQIGARHRDLERLEKNSIVGIESDEPWTEVT